MTYYGSTILKHYEKVLKREQKEGTIEELMKNLYCPLCKMKPKNKSKPHRGNLGRLRYTSCCDDMCYIFCQDCKAQTQHFHRWKLRYAIHAWQRGKIFKSKEAKCPGPSYVN